MLVAALDMEDNQPQPGPIPATVASPAPDPPTPVPPPALANTDIQCIAQAVAGFLQTSRSNPLQAGQPSTSQPGKFLLWLFHWANYPCGININ